MKVKNITILSIFLLAVAIVIFIIGAKISKPPKTNELTINIGIDDNWKYNSTPIIIRVKGVKGKCKKIDEYNFYQYISDAPTFKLPVGEYEITYISPMTINGNIYKMNNNIVYTSKFTMDDIDTPKEIDCAFDAAGSGTEEDVQLIIDNLKKINKKRLIYGGKDFIKEYMDLLSERKKDLKVINDEDTKIQNIIDKEEKSGKKVLAGTLRIFEDDDAMCDFMNIKNPNPYTGQDYYVAQGPYVILDFGKEVLVSGKTYFGDVRERKDNIVAMGYGKEGVEKYKQYEKKYIVLTYDGGHWPSDTSLPLGKLRINVENIIYSSDINNMSEKEYHLNNEFTNGINSKYDINLLQIKMSDLLDKYLNEKKPTYYYLLDLDRDKVNEVIFIYGNSEAEYHAEIGYMDKDSLDKLTFTGDDMPFGHISIHKDKYNKYYMLHMHMGYYSLSSFALDKDHNIVTKEIVTGYEGPDAQPIDQPLSEEFNKAYNLEGLSEVPLEENLYVKYNFYN